MFTSPDTFSSDLHKLSSHLRLCLLRVCQHFFTRDLCFSFFMFVSRVRSPPPGGGNLLLLLHRINTHYRKYPENISQSSFVEHLYRVLLNVGSKEKLFTLFGIK